MAELAKYRPTPTPLVALYPPSRQLSPRVRVFLDWASTLFGEALGSPSIRR